MKRTLTGIVAASMVLGTMAPIALANTSSTKYNHIEVSVGSSYSVSANGVAAQDPWTGKGTEFMPLWYLQQGLKAQGYTVQWNGSNQTLDITTPDGSTTGLKPITGSTKNDLVITINGVQVVKAPQALVKDDPATKKPTSFLPVFYIQQALKLMNITSAYNGTAGTWANTLPPAAPVNSGITGFVTDASGDALSGVTVTAGNQSATTDSNGMYSINLAPGSYSVAFAKSGFSTVKETGKTVDANDWSTVDGNLTSQLSSAISITGSVVNVSTGAPVVGAEVTLQELNPKTNTWSNVPLSPALTTDAAGQFTIDQTAAGNALAFGGQYKVTVGVPYTTSATGYPATTQTVTLASDGTSNVLPGFSLTPYGTETISGVVKNAAGAVLSGATVTLYDTDGSTVIGSPVTTSGTGAYSFTDTLPTGTYFVKVNDGVTADAIYTGSLTVTQGQNVKKDITVPAGQTVAATIGLHGVLDQFPAGSTYTLTLKDANGVVVTSDDTAGPGSAAAATFSDNLTNVAPGSYTLTVSGKYMQTASFPVTVGTTSATVSGRVNLAGDIQGTVTDGTNPLPGATVNLLDSSNQVVQTTTAAASTGTYEFDGVPAGTYTVQAVDSGYQTHTATATVTAGQDTTGTAVALTAVPTTASVSGYLREAGSMTPVTSGTVTYYSVASNGSYQMEKQVAPDATTGAYSVTGLQPGTYTVVVSDPGHHETYATTQSVKAGDADTNVTYSLQKGGNEALTVTVQDTNGKPISTPTVTLTDAYGNAVANSPAFTNLSAGAYTLTVSASGYQTSTQTVTIAPGETAGTMTVQLAPTATAYSVGMLVLNSTNAAVQGAKVVAFNANGQVVASSGSVIGSATTNKSGAATLNLTNGTYTVEVFQDGDIVSSSTVQVSGQNVTVPVVTLSAY